MTEKKDEIKTLLNNIEKLPNEDRVFIKKLFETYLSKDEINRNDITNLVYAIKTYFNKETSNSLNFFISRNLALDRIPIEITEKFSEAVKLLKELEALYSPKVLDGLIREDWPNGIRGTSIVTTLEPEEKVSYHTITLFTNNNNKYEIRQPLDITLQVLYSLTHGTNSSIKELKNANIEPVFPPGIIKKLKKEITELNKNLSKPRSSKSKRDKSTK